MAPTTQQIAHADTLARLPHRCVDCGRDDVPLYLGTAYPPQADPAEMLLCGACRPGPDVDPDAPMPDYGRLTS